MEFHAKSLISSGFQPKAGRELADHLLTEGGLDTPPKIDLRGLPPGLLGSGFFNGFLQRAFEVSPDRLATAKQAIWTVDYEFQQATWQKSVSTFVPRGPNAQSNPEISLPA